MPDIAQEILDTIERKSRTIDGEQVVKFEDVEDVLETYYEPEPATVGEARDHFGGITVYLMQTSRGAQNAGDAMRMALILGSIREAFDGLASENSIMRHQVGKTEVIDVTFDGPPGPEAGRFIDVHDTSGKGVKVGEWIDHGDGTWSLRLAVHRMEVKTS